MKYALLGTTGLRVSRLCLGTAAFGVVPQESDADRLVGAAFDAGVNFFDTATSYGNRSGQDRPGVPSAAERKSSEEILGECLKGRRDEVILATKVQERVGDGPNDGGPQGGGLTRYHMMKRLELSLRRLQTDHVDIYYAHHPDPTTPIEETLRAFDDMVKAGKVRYIALSTFPAWQVVNTLWKSDKLLLNAPVCLQVPYNLIFRGVEADVIPVAQKFGLSLTAFMPLHGGLLAGMEIVESRPISQLGPQRWRQGQGNGFTEGEMVAARQLDTYAKEWGLPTAQVALAWVLAQPQVASVIAGPETPDELRVNAGAVDLELSSEQLEALNAIRS